MPKAASKTPLTSQLKVELELKPSIKLVMPQSAVPLVNMLDNMLLEDKLNTPLEVNMSLEVKLNTFLEDNMSLEANNTSLEVKLNTPPEVKLNTPLESHNTPLDNTPLDNTLPAEVGSEEEKPFTELLKPEVMLLEAVESDTTDFFIHYFIEPIYSLSPSKCNFSILLLYDKISVNITVWYNLYGIVNIY
jgi:hypothetical protein